MLLCPACVAAAAGSSLFIWVATRQLEGLYKNCWWAGCKLEMGTSLTGLAGALTTCGWCQTVHCSVRVAHSHLLAVWALVVGACGARVIDVARAALPRVLLPSLCRMVEYVTPIRDPSVIKALQLGV